MGESADPIREERIRNAVMLARNMRNHGASLALIELRMVRRGLDASAIKTVMSQVPAEDLARVDDSSGISCPFLLVVVGLMISVSGLFLVVCFRDVYFAPFLGLGVLIIGGLLKA